MLFFAPFLGLFYDKIIIKKALFSAKPPLFEGLRVALRRAGGKILTCGATSLRIIVLFLSCFYYLLIYYYFIYI